MPYLYAWLCIGNLSAELKPSENYPFTMKVEELPEAPKQLSGKILLAEDHVDNRRLFVRLLMKLGLEVISAENGVEAVQLCRRHQPDLILMDIQMPEMDGIEAYKLIREQGYKRPILAITANTMSEEIKQYLALGFNSCMKKPVDRRVFVNTVAKYLTGPSREKTLEPSLEQNIVSVDISDLKAQYIQGLAKDQKDIIQALNEHDVVLLAELAHRLAGAAQMFGFAQLSQQAIELELAIKAGNDTSVPVLTERLCSTMTDIPTKA